MTLVTANPHQVAAFEKYECWASRTSMATKGFEVTTLYQGQRRMLSTEEQKEKKLGCRPQLLAKKNNNKTPKKVQEDKE
jgi:hypothetical protein